MRIIDLTAKQLNSEILPKHIRYNNEDLYFDGVSYCDEQGNNDLLDILAMGNSAITHLYDEVEIIEEDKKIEKIVELTNYQTTDMYAHKRKINETIDKINELIDAVNSMNKGGNDEKV